MNGTSKKLRASPIWLGGVVLGQKIPEGTRECVCWTGKTN